MDIDLYLGFFGVSIKFRSVYAIVLAVSALEMWCSGQVEEDNPQVFTLVHGVDRKGRAVIRAYTGNARHPVYQEYQCAIIKNYEKAARLSQYSRGNESPLHRVNNSSSDLYHSESVGASMSTPSTRTVQRWTSSAPSGPVRSTTITPEVKGMQAMISRLRSSLAIHSGLGPTNSEINFLPVIPVHVRKPSSRGRPQNGRLTGNTETKNSDFNYSVAEAKCLSTNKDSFKGCKGPFPQIKKTKKRKKKKDKKAHKLN